MAKAVSVWKFGMEKRARAAALLLRKDGHDVKASGLMLKWYGYAPAGDAAESYVKALGLIGVTIEPKGWEKWALTST